MIAFSLLICSIIRRTYLPCLELCRLRGGGFDQGNDDRRLNSVPLRLLGTGQPKCCHWINTVPDPGRGGKTKKRRGGENMEDGKQE